MSLATAAFFRIETQDFPSFRVQSNMWALHHECVRSQPFASAFQLHLKLLDQHPARAVRFLITGFPSVDRARDIPACQPTGFTECAGRHAKGRAELLDHPRSIPIAMRTRTRHILRRLYHWQGSTMNTRVENAHKWIKLVVDVSTLIALVSLILGYVLIRMYLSNFVTTILPFDTFSVSSLQIFGILFIVILGNAVAFFLVPFCAPYFVSSETRDNLQELFGRRNIPLHTLQARGGAFYDFLKEYAMFYLPTLVVISTMPIFMYFEIPLGHILWVILSSICISAFLLSIYRLKYLPKSETFYALLLLNFLTMMWVLFLEIGMTKSWEYAINKSTMPLWQAAIEVIVVSILVVLFHMSVAWANSIRALAVFSVIILGGFAVYPGYAFLGAAALREAQLGGGTRISYTVVGPRATTPEPSSGCLVLTTPSTVAIGELDDNGCPSLRRAWGITASEAKLRPVRVFSRSEINISEVPNG